MLLGVLGCVLAFGFVESSRRLLSLCFISADLASGAEHFARCPARRPSAVTRVSSVRMQPGVDESMHRWNGFVFHLAARAISSRVEVGDVEPAAQIDLPQDV